MRKSCLWRYRYLWFVIAGLSLIFVLILSAKVDYRNSDFFSFWLAGHMVWTGENPYIAQEWIHAHRQFEANWISDPRFLYPLPLSIFYAPFGLLPLREAYVLFVFLSSWMIIFSICILLSPELRDKHYIFPLLAGVALFRPVWITLHNGQIGALLLWMLAIVIWLWNQERWFWGGIIFAWAGLKPNLGMPIIGIVALWLILQRHKAALKGILVSGILLVLMGMALSPNWILEYWGIGHYKLSHTFGYASSLWGLSFYITKFHALKGLWLGWMTTILTLVGALFFLWKRHNSLTVAQVFAIAISSSLWVTPYTWPYDQVLLLIPIITILETMTRRRFPYLIVSITPLILDIIAILLLLRSIQIQKEVLNGIIPLMILIFSIYLFGATNASIRGIATPIQNTRSL